MQALLHRLLGDNVFMATLATIALPALAVTFIGLNLIIRDGSYVTQELQYLEWIGGGGMVANGIYGTIQAILAKKAPGAAPPVSPPGGPTDVSTN